MSERLKLHTFLQTSTITFISFCSWEYFPHDHARSRAYRWGEDGLLGITDRECRLCFGSALWNEKDPILKERLFGLTGNEGKFPFPSFSLDFLARNLDVTD